MFERGDLLKVTEDFIFGSFPSACGMPFVRDKAAISSHPRYRCVFPQSSILYVESVVYCTDEVFILTTAISGGFSLTPTCEKEDIKHGDSVYFKYEHLKDTTEIMFV